MRKLYCPKCSKISNIQVLGKDGVYSKVVCLTCSYKWGVRED